MTAHAERTVRATRWNPASTIWFGFMAGSWIAFGIAAVANPELLGDIWDWARGLPVLAEIAVWVLMLPWMLGMAVLDASWPALVEGALVAALAVGWTAVSLPPRA
jgi:hypothetical protein